MVVSSRRSFLKTAALTGLATAIAPTSLLGERLVDRSIEVSPNEKNLVFLFQGDSITDGNRGRNADPNHVMGHGYAFAIAIASRVGADFPHAGFTFFNRGVSGNSVPDLQKRWQSDTLALKPDVLSLLVGINDTNASIEHPNDAPGIEQFENGCHDLLQQCKTPKPDTLFVLGIPFVYAVGKRKEHWEQWRDGVEERAKIVRKLGKEFNAVLVDYPAMFEKAMKTTSADYWIWDGIHPTVFGHELMAREWIKQVSTRQLFLKKYRYK